MRKHAVASVVIGVSSCLAVPGAASAGTIGPDVIVSDIYEVGAYGNEGAYAGYSFGTESCNIGDAPAIWIDTQPSPNQHPVIGANVYRLKAVDGATRFEQIGMSWLKHSFCAVDGDVCGTCQTGLGCDWLGVGCSDPYDATLNGTQQRLGPRSEVNPWTGAFPYPYALAWRQTGGATYKRVRLAGSDLDPEQNEEASYFVEVMYVTTDEPAYGTQYNNASYRPLDVFPGFLPGTFVVTLAGSTIQQSTAVDAWADHDPGVVVHTSAPSGVRGAEPTDGIFFVGSKATELDDGRWHYEYLVYNYNADRAAASFAVPVPPGVTATEPEFHDVDYHSGEPQDGTDWSVSLPGGGGSVAWGTTAFSADPNANAIRWNTGYSFRFRADAGPVEGSARIGLFKPAPPEAPDAPGEVFVTALVPGAASCLGDVNGDGITNGADLSVLIGSFGASVAPGTMGDLNGDGIVNGADLSVLIGDFGCDASFPSG